MRFYTRLCFSNTRTYVHASIAQHHKDFEMTILFVSSFLLICHRLSLYRPYSLIVFCKPFTIFHDFTVKVRVSR